MQSREERGINDATLPLLDNTVRKTETASTLDELVSQKRPSKAKERHKMHQLVQSMKEVLVGRKKCDVVSKSTGSMED
jgi:hypothetical protein